MPDYRAIDQTMIKALADGVFPGAVLLVARGEEILVHQAYGFASLIPVRRPMTLDTIFDLASLTKPLAATTAVMSLIDRGRLGLDWTLQQLGAPFVFPGKEDVSIRQLLAHTAGFPAYRAYYLDLKKPPRERKGLLREMVQREPLETEPGTETVYSDLGFMFLEWICEILSGRDLHRWSGEEVYRPLGLEKMGFRPLSPHGPADPLQYAATEDCPWRKKVLCGEVHDENAYAVGGISGQAGLFGTAREVFRLVRALKRAYDHPDASGIFRGRTVREFWQRWASRSGNGRALGFDLPASRGSSAGRHFSPQTVGHLGFTGTSFWLDLERDLLVILLTNRVHPTRRNEKIRSFRPKIHDLIFTCCFS